MKTYLITDDVSETDEDNLCPTCEVDKKAYREMMHEECYHGHGEKKEVLKL